MHTPSQPTSLASIWWAMQVCQTQCRAGQPAPRDALLLRTVVGWEGRSVGAKATTLLLNQPALGGLWETGPLRFACALSCPHPTPARPRLWPQMGGGCEAGRGRLKLWGPSSNPCSRAARAAPPRRFPGCGTGSSNPRPSARTVPCIPGVRLQVRRRRR